MWIAIWLSLSLLVSPRQATQPPESPTAGSLVLMAGRGQIQTPTLVRSLASADPLVRALAARIAAIFDASVVRATLEAVLAEEGDPHTGAEMIHALLVLGGPEQFASIEPHARRIGVEARLAMYAWLARADAEKFVTLLPQIVSDLGPEERLLGSIALASALLNRPLLLEEYRAKFRPAGRQKPLKVLAADLSVSARLLPVFQRDLLSMAAAAGKCELGSSPRFGYAQLSLRTDGRAQKIAVDSSELSKECAEVLTGLARLTLADPDRPFPADGMQLLALPVTQAYAQCGPATPYAERPRTGADHNPPKKVKHVPPQYPPELQKNGVQGMVIIEATISEKGCVSSARVVQSPALGLSLAALRAVSGWIFESAQIEGKAVPTSMNLTVNFTLR